MSVSNPWWGGQDTPPTSCFTLPHVTTIDLSPQMSPAELLPEKAELSHIMDKCDQHCDLHLKSYCRKRFFTATNISRSLGSSIVRGRKCKNRSLSLPTSQRPVCRTKTKVVNKTWTLVYTRYLPLLTFLSTFKHRSAWLSALPDSWKWQVNLLWTAWSWLHLRQAACTLLIGTQQGKHFPFVYSQTRL